LNYHNISKESEPPGGTHSRFRAQKLSRRTSALSPCRFANAGENSG
jgi:hypothetical protein